MKGIMFRQEMHKAIREGRKTVTRRLDHLKEINKCPDKWTMAYFKNEAHFWGMVLEDFTVVKPRYHVGEVVYLKEAWCVDSMFNHLKPGEIPNHNTTRVYFVGDPLLKYGHGGKWRSPLFMPKWVLGLCDSIKITGVGLGRLQEITYKDCLAEGIVSTKEWQELNFKAPEPLHPEDLSNEEVDREIDRGWIEYCRQTYATLWDSINPKYPWASNPWVFVYQFKRLV